MTVEIRPFTPRETAYHYASGLVDDIAETIMTTQTKARIDALYAAMEIIRNFPICDHGSIPSDPYESAKSAIEQVAAAIQVVIDREESAP